MKLFYVPMYLLAIAIPPVVAAPGQAANDAPIQAVEIAPLFYQRFACMEHVNGELTDLGDALGTDCIVLGGLGSPKGFLRFYKTDGIANEDWYGWHVEVHAPFNGVVIEVAANRATNIPGTPGPLPPGYIKFERSDGLVVVYAHLDDTRVRQGDHVTVGQVVALCGNNGSARNPHVHVGAYIDKKPLQIRWDLAAEGPDSDVSTPAASAQPLKGPPTGLQNPIVLKINPAGVLSVMAWFRQFSCGKDPHCPNSVQSHVLNFCRVAAPRERYGRGRSHCEHREPAWK